MNTPRSIRNLLFGGFALTAAWLPAAIAAAPARERLEVRTASVAFCSDVPVQHVATQRVVPALQNASQ